MHIEKILSFVKKDNEFWEKVKNIIKKGFDSEQVCNEKYLKAKLKSHNGKINTNYHNCKYQKKILSTFVYQQFWSILFLEQVQIIYYPVFFESCKYVIKEKQILKYIIDDIEVSSDSNRGNSDRGNSDVENFDEDN